MWQSILSPFKTPIGLPKYGLLYFDHLLALHDVIAQRISDPTDTKLLDDAKEKRQSGTLEWKDIYAFDLVLLKYLDIGQLKSKLLTLRSQFRNIAGQKDTKLTWHSSRQTRCPRLMRRSCARISRYLLNEFYLRYSLTSSREHLRSRLLKIAACFTIVFLVVGVIIVLINNSEAAAERFGFTQGVNTISVVIFAGIVGAFISMQQRIQSAPNEGDPIYNFSVLTHGVFGIFLSPITGAIFSVVLYLMFVAGILEGSAFPRIRTPPDLSAAGTSTDPAAKGTPPDPAANGAAPDPATKGAAPDPAAKGAPQASAAIVLGTFSKETGPASGRDYALLLIWAFIAGFAERLVPDALNKLVVKSEAAKVPTT